MLKHIVMWRLQSQPHAAQLKALLEALPMTIAGTEPFGAGVNFAEGDAVCDVVLVSAFADLEALARYRVHPDHQKVVQFLADVSKERYVVDYMT